MNKYALIYFSCQDEDGVNFNRCGHIYFQDLKSVLFAQDSLYHDDEFPAFVHILPLNETAFKELLDYTTLIEEEKLNG